MTKNRLFRELIDVIAQATDERSLKAALGHLTTASGYDHFAFLNLHAKRVHAVSNYPAEWQDVYLARSYMIIDPIVTMAKRLTRVFDWCGDHERRRSTGDVKRFCDDAASFGIRSGVSVPVRTGLGRFAMLTFASSRNAKPSKNAEVDAGSAATAVALLHAKLAQAPTFLPSVTCAALNSREAACLSWVAEGKSLADIAAVEGIKYSTVRFHLDNAKAKLDVYTLPHATARATKLSLI